MIDRFFFRFPSILRSFSSLVKSICWTNFSSFLFLRLLSIEESSIFQRYKMLKGMHAMLFQEYSSSGSGKLINSDISTIQEFKNDLVTNNIYSDPFSVRFTHVFINVILYTTLQQSSQRRYRKCRRQASLSYHDGWLNARADRCSNLASTSLIRKGEG